MFPPEDGRFQRNWDGLENVNFEPVRTTGSLGGGELDAGGSGGGEADGSEDGVEGAAFAGGEGAFRELRAHTTAGGIYRFNGEWSGAGVLEVKGDAGFGAGRRGGGFEALFFPDEIGLGGEGDGKKGGG